MNYERIYNQLISRAKTRILNGYKERHHIVPKCIGGTDTLDNLIDLTAREHFIAHKLLCEIYPNNHKLLYAHWVMVNKAQSNTQQRLYNISSKEYERIKLLVSESRKLFKHTIETKRKISQSSKGRPAWNKGKCHSTETKKKISESNKGNVAHNKGKFHSAETKRKMSEWQQNRTNNPKSDEHKQKISKTLSGKKREPQSDDHKRKRIESFKNTLLLKTKSQK